MSNTNLSQARILVIDPFKNLRDIYQMFLREENYIVVTTSHLKGTSQGLPTDHYAVVITEFLPPFEEAFRSLRWVKEQSPETYVIVVTNAIVDEETYEKLFSIGVDDVILTLKRIDWWIMFFFL